MHQENTQTGNSFHVVQSTVDPTNLTASPILKKISQKRLIFTITTGRSGTGYLANFLAQVQNIAAHHEPEPNFAAVLRSIQHAPEVARRFWLEQKLPSIAASPQPIYCETSHLVGLGFIEPLLDLGIRPDLILLTRNKRAVATSMYRLDTIPGRTAKALRYYLSPEDPGVLKLTGWEKLHDYQLCYWYCLEVERRQKKYEREWHKIKKTAIWTSIDELKTIRGAIRLLNRLSINITPMWFIRYILKKNKAINTKSSVKNNRALPANIVELEKEIITLVKKNNK